ncbi:MAG: hypothetical protein E3J35_01890 [Methanomassiliicoccales archaeon]|nr:MAG: hypothetical protein E3J35_01890 [Methanomassiliicoccales archaeon]
METDSNRQTDEEKPDQQPAEPEEDKSSLDLIYETVLRSYDGLFQASESIDSKAGSIFNVGAVVASLFLATGVISIGGGGYATPEVSWLLATVTGLGLVFCIGAMMLSLRAWMTSEIEIINPQEFIKKFEDETETYTRKFLVVEIADEFRVNYERRRRIVNLVRSAQESLWFAVGTMLAFITVLVLSQLS